MSAQPILEEHFSKVYSKNASEWYKNSIKHTKIYSGADVNWNLATTTHIKLKRSQRTTRRKALFDYLKLDNNKTREHVATEINEKLKKEKEQLNSSVDMGWSVTENT